MGFGSFEGLTGLGLGLRVERSESKSRLEGLGLWWLTGAGALGFRVSGFRGLGV